MTRTLGHRTFSMSRRVLNNRNNDLAASLQYGTPRVIYEAPPIHRTLKPSLLRPLLFTVAVGVGSYGLAAYLTNADTQKQEDKLKSSGPSLFKRATSSVDLAMARRTELVNNAKLFLLRQLGRQPDINSPKTRIYTIVTEWWLNKTEAQRTCIGLIGLQGLVYLGWKVRPSFFSRAFTHYPLSGRSYTLLTSTFSHSSGTHFLFNSIAFYSFGPGAMAYLWQPNRAPGSDLTESTSKYHFLALFATAGVVSAFFSHAYSLLYLLPRAMTLGSRSASVLPSLGASGAIYATVVVTTLAYPNSQVSLIFLPFFSFPISAGVGGLILFDVVGLLSIRFRMMLARNLGVLLDHAGHLGGALCGWIAFTFGGPVFDLMRRVFDGKPNPKRAGNQKVIVRR